MAARLSAVIIFNSRLVPISSGTTKQRNHVFLNPTLLRYGLGSKWEARVESDSLLSYDDFAHGVFGYGPISAGAKYHFQEIQGNLPSIARN